MFKEKVSHKKNVYLFIAINMFLSFFLMTALPSVSAAQDDIEVNLFEFSSDPSDKKNQLWKKRLQEKILAKLKESAKITKLEFISDTRADMIVERERYYREKRIRYIIEGKIQRLSPKCLEIIIVLSDNEITKDNKEKFRWERVLKDNMVTLLAWCKKVSNEIYLLIEEKPIKEAVFTYCFETIGKDNGEVRQMKIRLPRTLKTKLEDKGFDNDYILNTFKKKSDVIKECEEHEEHVPDINVHEYIIRGDIELGEEPNEYIISVERAMTDQRGGSNVMFRAFRRKYSPTFFEELADHIMTEWTKK